MVAPLVGAWIEMLNNCFVHSCNKSLLSWERGLKFAWNGGKTSWSSVAPLVGAWIEIDFAEVEAVGDMSLLSWERGLKLCHEQQYAHRLCRSSRGSVD